MGQASALPVFVEKIRVDDFFNTHNEIRGHNDCPSSSSTGKYQPHQSLRTTVTRSPVWRGWYFLRPTSHLSEKRPLWAKGENRNLGIVNDGVF